MTGTSGKKTKNSAQNTAAGVIPLADGELLQKDAVSLTTGDALISSENVKREFFSIQAVGTPGNRRMRSGVMFTDTRTHVYRDQFTDKQWEAIIHDPHLKVIPVNTPEEMPFLSENVEM